MFRKLAMISLFCLFVTLTSATGDPLPGDPPDCITDCQQISTEYVCSSGKLRVLDVTDCSACASGTKVCQGPASGKACAPTISDIVTITLYEQGFAVCKDACKLSDPVQGMLIPSKQLGTYTNGRWTCTN